MCIFSFFFPLYAVPLVITEVMESVWFLKPL